MTCECSTFIKFNSGLKFDRNYYLMGDGVQVKHWIKMWWNILVSKLYLINIIILLKLWKLYIYCR